MTVAQHSHCPEGASGKAENLDAYNAEHQAGPRITKAVSTERTEPRRENRASHRYCHEIQIRANHTYKHSETPEHQAMPNIALHRIVGCIMMFSKQRPERRPAQGQTAEQQAHSTDERNPNLQGNRDRVKSMVNVSPNKWSKIKKPGRSRIRRTEIIRLSQSWLNSHW